MGEEKSSSCLSVNTVLLGVLGAVSLSTRARLAAGTLSSSSSSCTTSLVRFFLALVSFFSSELFYWIVPHFKITFVPQIGNTLREKLTFELIT